MVGIFKGHFNHFERCITTVSCCAVRQGNPFLLPIRNCTLCPVSPFTPSLPFLLHLVVATRVLSDEFVVVRVHMLHREWICLSGLLPLHNVVPFPLRWQFFSSHETIISHHSIYVLFWTRVLTFWRLRLRISQTFTFSLQFAVSSSDSWLSCILL